MGNYLGRSLDKISNIEILDNITFDGSSSYSITKDSVAFTPNSAQSLLISIDGVVQATNFSVNSSTIDFGVAVPSTSTCNFFLHYGTGVMTVPSDGSVTTAKLGDDAVTKDKVSNLMYPAFESFLSADQSNLADNVATKLQANTEVFDTDSCYDNSTNYRFTPTVAGRYFVYHNSKLQVNTTATMGTITVAIYRNGSELKNSFFDPIDGQVNASNMICSTITYMNGTSDYLEAYGRINVTGGNQWRFDAGVQSCTFGAYRIGD